MSVDCDHEINILRIKKEVYRLSLFAVSAYALTAECQIEVIVLYHGGVKSWWI